MEAGFSTEAWRALDDRHHLHPFSDPRELAERGTTIITRGRGSYVWDSEGKKILDGMAGLWCVNVGYGRDELVDVAASQMRELPYYNSFFQSATPSQISLAKRLSEVTPKGIDNFFFTNSGSEANDTVIRLVYHYWKLCGQPSKRVFIGRHLGYHGSTLAATSLGGMKAMHDMGHELLPGFEHIMEPHWYRHGANQTPEQFAEVAAAALEDKIAVIGAANVAAFIAEPVQGAGGVIDPPPGYWDRIQKICRKHDILLVADEVICGFGRLGEWFGSQYYGIQPDLMPIAKGLSSGYMPIAAVGIGERVHHALYEGGPIPHGYTYSGHPVACAVAEANIEIIAREGLVDRVREDVGPYFRGVLQQIADVHPLVGELRGAGLLAGLQLMKDRTERLFFDPSEKAAVTCREIALQNGLIARAVGHTMVLCPPLTITRGEIDEMGDKMMKSLDATAKDYGVQAR
ncbi:aminotransferase [Sphingopyxis sp. R3-92]|uniref:aminotransferase n=1 Tax=Sphingopyxis sp. R3-92 TaxID=3158553 RepID=UPI003EE63E43